MSEQAMPEMGVQLVPFLDWVLAQPPEVGADVLACVTGIQRVLDGQEVLCFAGTALACPNYQLLSELAMALVCHAEAAGFAEAVDAFHGTYVYACAQMEAVLLHVQQALG